MSKVELRYVQAFRDRHGKRRYYFRRPGFKRIPLPGLPGTPDFMGAYQAAMAGETAPARQVGEERTKAGTFAALIVAYYGSADFKTLSASTRQSRRGVIEGFRAKHGDKPVSQMQAKHIRALLDEKAATPAAANNLLKALRTLMRFAVERGWRDDDPTVHVRKVSNRTDGFHSWTEEEIAAFEKKWPLGSRARLAMALLLYTAQRRSDVVTMGRQHVRDGSIQVCQQKTSTRLAIPIHPELKKALDATPADNMTFLVTAYGKPFSPAGFTNWFRECVREAGLSDECSPHGLRKAASRRLAEAGASPHQIMAVTGHKSLKEVVVYTAAANQEQLAKAALATITGTEREAHK
ncbi:tyrosine-type recombinase/integrase [Phenylobacterium sp.]|uniref:tyrosine-type recombinase/integrase n=1 Tax=Phenylobacterium sp. TaxID=1871053 RepID=UPI0035AF730F